MICTYLNNQCKTLYCLYRGKAVTIVDNLYSDGFSFMMSTQLLKLERQIFGQI